GFTRGSNLPEKAENRENTMQILIIMALTVIGLVALVPLVLGLAHVFHVWNNPEDDLAYHSIITKIRNHPEDYEVIDTGALCLRDRRNKQVHAGENGYLTLCGQNVSISMVQTYFLRREIHRLWNEQESARSA